MKEFILQLDKFGEKRVIFHNGKEYSYKKLLEEIRSIKNTLLIGSVKRGDVVSILSDYSFESIALLLALYENNNIIVPITSTVDEEINHRVNESYTDFVIRIDSSDYCLEKKAPKPKHEMIKQLQNKSQAGLILFSSGSTGKPKAMIHDFNRLVKHYLGKKEKSLNMILFLMFDHIGGLNTLLNILSIGSTIIIPIDRNVDTVCELIQDHRIRVLPSSPTFLNLILMSRGNERYDLSSLRMISYGTESMPDSLLLRLKEQFPRTKFLQTFGTSETGIATTRSKSSDSTFMKIDDPNLNYKIVNGELWLKSNTQVMGYLNASMESFTKDGWFKTGDLVELMEGKYIKIIGRANEVVNVGGEKVLPAEVESIILQMNEIEDVIVYSENSAITGQIVVADVVIKGNFTSLQAKRVIREFCKGKISNYKLPSKVNIVERTSYSSRFKKIRFMN